MRDPLIASSALVLFSLLLFAFLTVEVLSRKYPNKDFTEVKIRTRSWSIIVLVLESAFFIGKFATVAFIACVSFFSLREYLSRVPTRVSDRKILFWVFLAIPIQYYFVNREWFIAFMCFIPLYGITVIAVRLLFAGSPKGFVLGLSTFQLGLLTTVYSVSHIAYLPLLSNSIQFNLAVGTLLYFICVTQANDVFQFISGKTFGRTKILPLISPKKTVEGFLGGIFLSSALGGVLATSLTPFTSLQGIIAGMLLSVFGFFGDVLMSAIKRDLEIKDFSQIIPGHGGILDRIDSLIISAPLYFHLIRIVSES